jgi:hypothetical protein
LIASFVSEEIIFKFFHFNGNITVSVFGMYTISVERHEYFVKKEKAEVISALG